MYRTLGSTKGFKQIRLLDCFCGTGAQSKARNFGLKQTKNTTATVPVMPVHDPVFDDDNDKDYKDPDLAHDLLVIEPKFAGGRLEIQAVPRFDLHKMKPFKVMFSDSKDYPCYVRGGFKTTFLFVDYKLTFGARLKTAPHLAESSLSLAYTNWTTTAEST